MPDEAATIDTLAALFADDPVHKVDWTAETELGATRLEEAIRGKVKEMWAATGLDLEVKREGLVVSYRGPKTLVEMLTTFLAGALAKTGNLRQPGGAVAGDES